MKQKKILFIDDEAVVVGLMKTRIESRGFLAETAMDGLTGIEKAKTWHPDLILLDIVMSGMDGYETCRHLKGEKETAHIPVVFFTAVQNERLDALAKKAGAAKVIQKPFIDQVFKTIAEILKLE